MSKRELSRRGFLTGVTSVALTPLVAAQTAPPATPEAEDMLLTAAKNSARATSNARLSFKLPENSEPCFVFPVTPVKERKR
jgi:hypothetical protein